VRISLITITIVMSMVLISENCFSQTDTTRKTILKIEPSKTPLQIIKDNASDTTLPYEDRLQSGENSFSAEQDSAYFRAIKSNVSLSAIISSGLQLSNDLWLLQRELAKGTPWQLALENVRNIPKEFYIPTGVELVHHQIALENSQYIPYIRNMPQFGKYNIEAIMNLLGLIEDVSPEISYSIDYATDIEIVVYSISSVVVATLFNGRQLPGRYSISWNGRDSKGKVMPPGNYIAEVRIGKERYVRKRILIR